MNKCRYWNILWTVVFAFPHAVRGQAGNGFVCVSAGRFPDPTNCSRYYSCFLDPTTGNLLLSPQICPGTSIFNPATAKCTAAGGAYTCTPTTTTAATTTTTPTTTTPTTTTPITTTQTTTTPTTTTQTTTTASTTTEVTTTATSKTPKPTTTKKTTTPKTTTTKKTTTPKTTTTESVITTTPSTITTTKTVTPATTTTTTTTTTTPRTTTTPITTTPVSTTTLTAATTTTATIRADESCVSPGRFPEPTDCSRYYACFRDPTSGELIRSNYTCPGTSIFNPATSKCTASGGSFTCIPTTTASTTTSTTTSTSSTTTTTTEATTTQATTTESTTTTQTTAPTSTTTVTTTTTTSCNTNGFLCPTSTSFQLCSAGQPIGDPIPCSSGLLCSESCSLFCVEDVSTC